MISLKGHPFIAFSPNCLVSFKCCGAGLLEVVSPQNIRHETPTVQVQNLDYLEFIYDFFLHIPWILLRENQFFIKLIDGLKLILHKKSLPQIFWAETYILNFTWTVATNKMRAKWELWNKKSCRCEEGGAHFKISVWHLLMNLKNNYLLKKLKWINKKRENFNIYNVVFFKKQIKKNTWRSW